MKKKFLSLTLAAGLLATAVIGGTLAYFTDTETVTNTFTAGNVDITLTEAETTGSGQQIVKGENEVITPEKNGYSDEQLWEANRIPTKELDGNDYDLHPGRSYVKDPTVTIEKGSRDCYVWMEVKVAFDEELTPADLTKLGATEDKLDLEQTGIITGYSSDWKLFPNLANENTTASDVTIGEGDAAKQYKTVITYRYLYQGEKADETAHYVKATDATNVIKLPALFKGISVPENWDNDEMDAVGDFDIYINAYAIQADGFDTAQDAWNAANPTGGAIWKHYDGLTPETDTSSGTHSEGGSETGSTPAAPETND